MKKIRPRKGTLLFFINFRPDLLGWIQPSGPRRIRNSSPSCRNSRTASDAIKTLKADYVRDLLPKVSSALPSAPLKAEGRLIFASPDKLRSGPEQTPGRTADQQWGKGLVVYPRRKDGPEFFR